MIEVTGYVSFCRDAFDNAFLGHFLDVQCPFVEFFKVTVGILSWKSPKYRIYCSLAAIRKVNFDDYSASKFAATILNREHFLSHSWYSPSPWSVFAEISLFVRLVFSNQKEHENSRHRRDVNMFPIKRNSIGWNSKFRIHHHLANLLPFGAKVAEDSGCAEKLPHSASLNLPLGCLISLN